MSFVKSAVLVLIYCGLAYAIAWGYYEDGTYRSKKPNITMEEYCPGWGRPANWHIPPRTPRPGCCKFSDSSKKYYETLCWKYGWKPPKGWKRPKVMPTKRPRATFPPGYPPGYFDDDDYDYHYYDDY